MSEHDEGMTLGGSKISPARSRVGEQAVWEQARETLALWLRRFLTLLLRGAAP